MKLNSKPDHGVILTNEGKATILLQLYLDDIERKLNNNLLGEAVMLPAYVIADLPSASKYKYGQIIVTDEVGGEVAAISDGVSWRRSTDRAIVS